MMLQRLCFYLLCFITVVFSLIIFKIQFAMLFVSIVAIIISVTFGILRFGMPPFKEIYWDFKRDFCARFGLKNNKKMTGKSKQKK